MMKKLCLALLLLPVLAQAQSVTADKFKVRCDTVPSGQPGVFLIVCDNGDKSLHLIGQGTGPSILVLTPGTLADLGSPADGSFGVCNDCVAQTSPCTSGGSDTVFAFREAGAWTCLGAAGGGSSAVVYVWLQAAGCNNTFPSSAWNLLPSEPAVELCSTGTNTQDGILQFAVPGSTTSAQRTLTLPLDFNSGGSTNLIFKWSSAGTSGDMVWHAATSCVADGATNDPAWNAASTVIDTTQGVANSMNTATITGIDMTGCAAGRILHVKVYRETSGSDTLASPADLYGVMLTIPRS